MATPFSNARLGMSQPLASPPGTRPQSLHTAREYSSSTGPRRASSTRGVGNRHGSAEQDVDHFGGPLQRPPTTPRRGLSPENGRQSRERERRDWRSPPDPGTPADAPAGFGSRLLVMENHLRETIAEVKKLRTDVIDLKDLNISIGSFGSIVEDIQTAKNIAGIAT